MEPQGLDRTAILGIVLMSLILGLWMIQSAPSPEEIQAQQAAADSAAAVQAPADGPPAVATEDADQARTPPVDSAFARALGRPERRVVVLTDRYQATFSSQGGTPVSFKLRNYDHSGTGEPVELISDSTGALAVGVLPSRGDYLDTRVLSFTPIVDGRPFTGDTLRIEEGEGDLRFEAPVGEGALRFVYGFHHDSYDVDFRVEAPGTNLLAQGGGYELIWDGAIPQAEADRQGEVTQAGAFVRYGGDTESLVLKEPGELDDVVKTGSVDWVAVKTKFFIAAIIPETETAGAKITASQTGEADVEDGAFAQDYAARLEMPRQGAGEAAAFTLYLGPLELRRLADYGLYDTVDFGAWVGAVIRPIAQYVVAPVFAFLSTFIPNYGLVILVFALIVKLLLWPLTAVSYRNAAKMRELAPQLTAVKEKYGEDPQKQQQAMMAVYKEAGVNPLGGCLPMLLQYPLLIALWRFFQSTLVLRGESFLWAADLSAPDPVLHLPFTIPFVGNFLSGFTILMGDLDGDLDEAVDVVVERDGRRAAEGADVPDAGHVLRVLQPVPVGPVAVLPRVQRPVDRAAAAHQQAGARGPRARRDARDRPRRRRRRPRHHQAPAQASWPTRRPDDGRGLEKRPVGREKREGQAVDSRCGRT